MPTSLVDTSRIEFDTFRILNPKGLLSKPNTCKLYPFWPILSSWDPVHKSRYQFFYWPQTHLSLGRPVICTHFTVLSERIGLSSILISGVISITFLTLGYI